MNMQPGNPTGDANPVPTEPEAAAQTPWHPIWTIWPPLLFIPCVPVWFMTVYNMGPLGALAGPTQAYIGACQLIAPGQLIYGLILLSRKHPRAGLHIGSAIALGVLLALAIPMMMAAFAGGIV